MMLGTMMMCAVLQLGAKPVEIYEDHKIIYSGGDYTKETFHYRLMKPEKIEKGKKYPLVLFLHGAGERGNDNKNQLQYFPTIMADEKHRQKYPCYILAPQCRKGKKWSSARWGEKKSRAMPKEPTDQMKVAIMALDHCIKENKIDKNRIYLTGLSMGGYGSWELAMRRPKMFAAVVPICGGGDQSQAKLLVKTPLWAWHGDADPAVPVERSRNMIAAIKKSGGKPKYTELKGVGHNSWTPAYTNPKGAIPWMFKQVKK